MKNFTSLNYPSWCSGSFGHLMKGLLLCMAMVLFHLTPVQAQQNGDYTPHPSLYQNLDALQGSSFERDGDQGLPSTANNPTLDPGSNCDDLRIILVLDESGSMNGAAEAEARNAALVLAQSFDNTLASLRILEFSSEARFIDLDEVLVNDAYLTNLEAYLNGGYTDLGGNFAEYASNPGGNPPCAPGYTNWDNAFQTIAALPSTETPNLVLFLTDGNPTAYNGGPDFDLCGYTVSVSPNTNEAETIMASLAASINSSNVVKSNLTKIFPIGVGNGVNVANLQLISGTQPFSGDIFNDDYAVGDINEIQDNLTAGINSICGTALSIEKSVDIEAVCNGDQVITFTLAVTNVGDDNDVAATNVVITDTFPDAFDILLPLPEGVSFDEVNNVITYNAGTLEFDETVEIQISATISEIGEYTNSAYANANNANKTFGSVSVERSDVLTSELNITSCGTYVWNEGEENEEEFAESGVFVRSDVSEAGCPTEVTLNITINSEADPIDVVVSDACGSYTWIVDEEEIISYNEPGTYTNTTTVIGVDGQCDQVYNLNLTILEAEIEEEVVVICEPQPFPLPSCYSDNLGTYCESGVYVRPNGFGQNGCPKTNILYLTLNLAGEIGVACNDGNPLTENDVTTADCGCEGTLVLCESPTLSLALSADEAGQTDVADCLEADGTFWVQATIEGGSGNESGYNALVNGELSQVAAEGTFAFGSI